MVIEEIKMREYFSMLGKKLKEIPTSGEFVEKRYKTDPMGKVDKRRKAECFYIALNVDSSIEHHLVIDGKYVFIPAARRQKQLLTKDPFPKGFKPKSPKKTT